MSQTQTDNTDRTVELEYAIRDPVTGPRRVEREIPVPGILEDGRVVLWRDPSGWEGIEYDQDADEFHYVNVSNQAGYVGKSQLSLADVEERIQNHIDDDVAGGPGQFVRGATPL